MSVPIHQVRSDGTVRQIGEWIGSERRLDLTAPGFPLLGPGSHTIEGELPWVFWDMCPSGFLGRRFANIESELRLSSDPRTWTPTDVMTALTTAGHSLSGNLVLGNASLERVRSEVPRAITSIHDVHDFDIRALDLEETRDSSSLGGERPKLAFPAALVKYSPPLSTSAGSRWSDLLRMELHSAQTLTAAALRAVRGATFRKLDRTWLALARFDRAWQSDTAPLGRVGAVTFYWLAMDRFGDVRTPAPQVAERLVAEGHLGSESFGNVDRVHAFSSAIGNNDAHLGNYGLTFDDEGRASVAPFYDISPMALAPAHDELPDARLLPRTQPIREDVRELVNDLVKRAEADTEISREFLDLWRRHIGV